jgi:acetyl-CoA carboxylase carboxyl transferase subunit alpha
VLSIVDSAGAYPGIGAEERGQAEAIAQAFDEMRNFDASGIRQQRRQKFLDIGRKLG